MKEHSSNDMLIANCTFYCSLHPQEQQWREYMKEHSSNDMLIANCMSAAAFLVYCGGLNTDTRYNSRLSSASSKQLNRD